MLIGVKNERNLEKSELFGSDTFIRASELLYEIINHSYQVSYTCLETEINGSRFNISGLYSDCRNKIELLNKGGEKAEFLSMSVLEDTFNKALPLLLVNVEEIANGNLHQAECVNELRTIFEENPYKQIWNKKAEAYRELLNTLGLTLEYSDYSDLTAIMEPLLNALTLFEGENYCYPPKTYKVRDGKAGTASPHVMNSVYMFRSEKEFTDFLMHCGKDSVIAFGAVEQTYRQTQNYFYDYMHGRPDEIIRNGMKNNSCTKEEYLNETDTRTRAVYLGVKSGEMAWIMKMPYKSESYHHYDSMKDRYYYGRRAGYAPYEVFFKDNPALPEETTILSVRHVSYKLNDLMDDHQKIWLPVFLEEVRNRFFKEEIKAETLYFPEEMAATAGKNEIMPVNINLPDIRSFCYKIQSPEEVFKDEPTMLKLLHYFKITEDALKDVPLLPNECLTQKEIKKVLDERVQEAYIKETARCIIELLDTKWAVREQLRRYITDNTDIIIEKTKSGMFKTFTEVLIDGAPVLNTDGTPKMTKNNWNREKPLFHRITTDDFREPYRYMTNDSLITPYTVWYGDKANKPGVVMTISPATAEQYACLLGMDIDDLPKILKLSEELKWFYEKYKTRLPYSETYERVVKTNEEDKTIYLPKIATVKIGMRKNTYKSFFLSPETEK